MFANAEISNFDQKKEIKLEPRLIEYIKKKKFYKENNLDGQFIEKEFNIDISDISKIKNFFAGKKIKKNTEHTDMIQQETNEFESDMLHNDIRIQRMNQKQQRHKDAIDQKNNYDIMARGYDMYRNDRKFSSAYGNDFKSRFNPQVWMEDKDEMASDYEDSNPNLAQRIEMKDRFTNPNNYKNKPAKIRFKDYMPWTQNSDLANENYSLDSIIGNLNSYTEKLDNYHRPDQMDFDNKVSTPGGKCSNKRGHENNYKAMPLMNGPKQKDINIENYLCYGSTPARGAKSLGYPNPAEHYFQYISNDISKPEHSVFEPGMPSRLFNKEVARDYKGRDIMP
jgi:hypothetical protein